jgi:hypothetical protein
MARGEDELWERIEALEAALRRWKVAALSAVAALVLVLLGGLAVGAVQWQRAEAARRDAMRAAEEAHRALEAEAQARREAEAAERAGAGNK